MEPLTLLTLLTLRTLLQLAEVHRAGRRPQMRPSHAAEAVRFPPSSTARLLKKPKLRRYSMKATLLLQVRFPRRLRLRYLH